MGNELFQLIANTITHRRTTKVNFMNGEKIADEEIAKLLELADSAPTHGRTEPWRFIVYKDKSLQQFCADHAQLYWETTDEKVRTETKRTSIQNQYKNASHLIITYMKRTENARIPAQEEYAAVCAAVQNMQIGATALGIACIWSTGGATYKPEMKKYLALQKEDEMVALLFLGKSDKEAGLPVRNIPLNQKTIWK